ncbi:rhomboid family intramembrane serine protease [Sediminibacillus massiliensis]|uniref:rhomboid family intramembrane serine protease n=1 Tax=Sediminibacillus massiliensis TaxID=1926277 RepID=UPI0009887804|nr:rhomboid family intramembrane serine protease [Sediminibacillus massiliensis]
MLMQEEYLLYQISAGLTEMHGFEILHLDNVKNEIWLEKKIKDSTHVVRLFQKGFGWQNHMKSDISAVSDKVKRLRSMIVGRSVKIHNVYINWYPPVDQWESLKKPVEVPGIKQTEILTYYLNQYNLENELERFYSNLHVENRDDHLQLQSELAADEAVLTWKRRLMERHREARKKEHSVFTYGRPVWVFGLLIINFLLFFFLEQNGGSMNVKTLIDFGAKYNPAIKEGEWWRIVSSMFLHIGFFHLLMNMLALYYLGAAVEKIYGSFRFTVIYFSAGISGGLASFAFNTQVSAGASGAIFGLFGALLFFGITYKKLFFRTMGWNLLFILAINIIFGFVVPQVDNGAHIGGLVGGFAASAFVALPDNASLPRQLAAFAAYIAVLISLVFYGLY